MERAASFCCLVAVALTLNRGASFSTKSPLDTYTSSTMPVVVEYKGAEPAVVMLPVSETYSVTESILAASSW